MKPSSAKLSSAESGFQCRLLVKDDIYVKYFKKIKQKTKPLRRVQNDPTNGKKYAV
jgi:hypothetical protein